MAKGAQIPPNDPNNMYIGKSCYRFDVTMFDEGLAHGRLSRSEFEMMA